MTQCKRIVSVMVRFCWWFPALNWTQPSWVNSFLLKAELCSFDERALFESGSTWQGGGFNPPSTPSCPLCICASVPGSEITCTRSNRWLRKISLCSGLLWFWKLHRMILIQRVYKVYNLKEIIGQAPTPLWAKQTRANTALMLPVLNISIIFRDRQTWANICSICFHRYIPMKGRWTDVCSPVCHLFKTQCQ